MIDTLLLKSYNGYIPKKKVMATLEIQFSKSGKTKYFCVRTENNLYKMSSKKQAILLVEELNNIPTNNDIQKQLPSKQQQPSSEYQQCENQRENASFEKREGCDSTFERRSYKITKIRENAIKRQIETERREIETERRELETERLCDSIDRTFDSLERFIRHSESRHDNRHSFGAIEPETIEIYASQVE